MTDQTLPPGLLDQVDVPQPDGGYAPAPDQEPQQPVQQDDYEPASETDARDKLEVCLLTNAEKLTDASGLQDDPDRATKFSQAAMYLCQGYASLQQAEKNDQEGAGQQPVQ